MIYALNKLQNCRHKGCLFALARRPQTLTKYLVYHLPYTFHILLTVYMKDLYFTFKKVEKLSKMANIHHT